MNGKVGVKAVSRPLTFRFRYSRVTKLSPLFHPSTASENTRSTYSDEGEGRLISPTADPEHQGEPESVNPSERLGHSLGPCGCLWIPGRRSEEICILISVRLVLLTRHFVCQT